MSSINATSKAVRIAGSDFAALKRDFDRNGFVVLRNFLDEAELTELRERAIPLARDLLDKNSDSEKYRNVLKSLHRHDDWFDNQLAGGRHVPLLRHLLDDDIFGASAAWFDRPEGAGLGIGPHVDALGRDHFPGRGATIWFALDPVNASNGCLHYLTGSHKKTYPDVIPIPGIDTQSEDVFVAELAPGDAVIHTALTVHWSGGNPTERPRRAVSYFYFSASEHAALNQSKEA